MSVVVGTAGHIDHGKTTLIKALTGVSCDRLEEEKKRGITIQLGFAHIPLPSGEFISIIDVPGHERFVKNMVAGTSGIDFVLLVIAADEGIMPQTREHLDICSLLGIRRGLLVITKVDLVEHEWLDLVKAEIAEFLQGSFLESAPLYQVSATTNHGIDTLREAIIEIANSYIPHRRHDLPRLPVDRVFSLHGHGTIVTGTLTSGGFSLEQTLVLMPSGAVSRVRGLQSHGKPVKKAQMGYRTAVNLPDLEMADIKRGDVLTIPNRLFPSLTWIVELHCLPSFSRSLRNKQIVHMYHGAKRVLAQLRYMDRDTLEAGATALCTVTFNEPMVSVAKDTFIIRAGAPLETVAGGKVLYPLALPEKGKKNDAHTRVLLQQLQQDSLSIAEQVILQLELVGQEGAPLHLLTILINEDEKNIEKDLQNLCAKQEIFLVDKEERRYISKKYEAELADSCCEWLELFHKKEPLKTGVNRNALSSGWGKNVSSKLVHFIMQRLLAQEKLVIDGDFIRLKSHSIVLSGTISDVHKKIVQAYTGSEYTPPNIKDLLDSLEIPVKQAMPIITLLLQQGTLIKINENIYYEQGAFMRIEEKMRNWFQTNETMSLNDFRDMTELSRKYCVALLEYFDATRLTIRAGDDRLLRDKK